MNNQKLNQSGQSILEYVLLSSLIGIICLLALQSTGKSLKTKIKAIKTRVERLDMDER